jgi:hypothetical protein
MKGVVIVAMLLGPAVAASASMVCEKKSGVVVIRDACKKKETPVNLAAFGAIGPKGDKGDPGTPGGAGHAGPPGLSAYEIVQAGPYSGGGQLTVACPGTKKAIGGGCEDNFTSAQFVENRPSADGAEWICGFNGSDLSIHAYAVCANVQ